MKLSERLVRLAHRRHWEARRLSVWVVYDHPSDVPNAWVARRFERETPTGDVIESIDLDMLRYQLAEMGLVRQGHLEVSDPKIVETWL